MLKTAFVVAALVIWCTPVFAIGSVSRNLLDDEMRVFAMVNQERIRRNLPPMQWDGRLSDLARSYSRQMANGGRFDHYDDEGATVIQRAKRARIKGWRKIGENLFVCGGVREFVGLAVRGWLKSPTHREAMLDPVWTATGIGIARATNGEIYITEVFIQD
jgi:uncharacterized protein YkwD